MVGDPVGLLGAKVGAFEVNVGDPDGTFVPVGDWVVAVGLLVPATLGEPDGVFVAAEVGEEVAPVTDGDADGD